MWERWKMQQEIESKWNKDENQIMGLFMRLL